MDEREALRLNEHTRALERAAAPVLAAIAEDSQAAPAWLRPLFGGLAEQLFDPELSLEQIQHVAGMAQPKVSDPWRHFQEEVGQTPWSYLRAARLETAAHLLLESDISISDIGCLVGYGSASTFRRPLQSFLGMPPSRYRRQARRRLAQAGPPPAGSDSPDYWHRMAAGALTDAEARALDDYLARHDPGRPSPSETAEPADDTFWPVLLWHMAWSLTEAFEPVPDEPEALPLRFADQRRLIREAVRFPNETLFEHLSQLSAQACREDPERGIELALLAIDSLVPNEFLETEPALAALAWARLARVRWHAGDLQGAEQDLERAAQAAAAVDDDPPAVWAAERSRVLTAFRWFQGRRLDGLDLAEAMVSAQRAACCKATAAAEGVAAALLLRAELRAAAAELEPSSTAARARWLRGALTDVEEAYGLLTATSSESPAGPGPGEPVTQIASLRRGLFSLWARLLVQLGNRGETLAGLASIRQAAEHWQADLADRAAPLLSWLEGHADTDPETGWRQARERFTRLGDELWAARLTLDLAHLSRRQGRPGEATALASELASLLGTLAASAEDLAAIEPLRRAAPFRDITEDELDAAEAVLQRFEWSRRARRALALAW